ncbi:MAG: hypothetical protein ACYDCP_10960 [Thermoplasmataceae archaeon]
MAEEKTITTYNAFDNPFINSIFESGRKINTESDTILFPKFKVDIKNKVVIYPCKTVSFDNLEEWEKKAFGIISNKDGGENA